MLFGTDLTSQGLIPRSSLKVPAGHPTHSPSKSVEPGGHERVGTGVGACDDVGACVDDGAEEGRGEGRGVTVGSGEGGIDGCGEGGRE